MKLFSTLAVGALALAAALPMTRSAAPAADASTLAITSMQCWDLGGGGPYYNYTECQATASGGSGTLTFDWDVIVNYQYDTSNSSYMHGVCTDSYPVTLTVTDGAGGRVSQSEVYECAARGFGSDGGIDP